MANGRVATGFSKPIVAKYEAEGTTVTYTGAMPLARGVDVTLTTVQQRTLPASSPVAPSL